MLRQNIRDGWIDSSVATSLSSEITKQDSYDQVSRVEALQMSQEKEERPFDGSKQSNSKNGDPCSLNTADDGSRPSTFSAMPGRFKSIVYHRKRFGKSPSVTFSGEASAEVRPSNGCPSELCSEVYSETLKEDLVAEGVVKDLASNLLPTECNRGGLLSKSNSCDGSREGEEQCSSRSDMQRTSHFCVNDSYSSSKCDLDFGSSSLKTDVDDAGECSSSGALPEGLYDKMPVTDICIALLQGYGLFKEDAVIKLRTTRKAPNCSPHNCCLVSCKACECSETTWKMLICDNCDDAYHLSCSNPRLRKVTRNKWFCQSCLIKKRKLLEKSTFIPPSGHWDFESCSNLLSEGESGRMSFMLKDTSIYRTCVRVGANFQAEVPDWAGPVIDEVDRSGEPLKIEPLCLRECSSNKRLGISSIGNWVQCRQVIEDIAGCEDGSICGKWRRAPLFEVQTDDWECFRTVLWDPAHADCAVPQELETEEVLKQLKYIETLKPRLAVKRRKLDQTAGASSQSFTEI